MSLRLTAFLFLMAVLMPSCNPYKEEPLTISEEKMVQILMDAHIMESALQDVKHKKRDSTKQAFYNQFYEIHGITEEEFVANIEIMDKQPTMLSRIYSKVMEEVSKQEADN